jgi:hypothetical protein
VIQVIPVQDRPTPHPSLARGHPTPGPTPRPWLLLALLAPALAIAHPPPGISNPTASSSPPLPPSILQHPVHRTVEEGDYVAQYHSVSGTPPLTFTWFRDGTELRNLQAYNGGYSVILTLDARLSDTGQYWFVARNAWGAVTSQVVRITVQPAPPNPEYSGRRFTRLVSANTTPSGTTHAFLRPSPYAPVRWLGNQLLFSGQGSNNAPLGLLESSPRYFRVRIPTGTPLPNQQGTLLEAQVPDGAGPDAPLIVVAQVEGAADPGALYLVDGENTLIPRIDRLTPVPGAPGESFTRLVAHLGLSPAVQHGERVVFTAETAHRSGAYLLEGATVRRLLDSTQDLPGAPAGPRHLRQLGSDGNLVAMVWDSEPSNSFLGLWLLDLEANTPPTQVVIDRFPDGSQGLARLHRIVVHDGTVYFTTPNPTGYASVHAWRNGTLRTLMEPASIVEAAGGMSGVDPLNLHVDQGYVFAYAFMQQDNGRIPVMATPEGPVHWLLARKIDGHRARYQGLGASVLGATAGRIAVWVPFDDANRPPRLHANLSPVLHHLHAPAGTLTLQLPAHTQLEQAGSPDGPWTEVPEAGNPTPVQRSLQVPASQPASFLRLRDTTRP